MTTLDLLRFSHERTDPFFRPRRSNHFALDCDWLEPRHLLSAVQATTSTTTGAPAAISATPGATAGATTIGPVGSGGTVQTTGIGSVQFIQSSLPVQGLLENLDNAVTTVYESPGPISVSSGLLSLPISPILPSNITGNETPLNNGTPILGTVWITPVPEPPGVFHPNLTASATTASTWLQTPNPQYGPPSFTQFGAAGNHFGQGQGVGTQNGATVSEQAVAVGPDGPPLMDQVEPAQAPSQAAQQPVGLPPAQQGSPAENAAAPGHQGVQSSQNPGGTTQQGGTGSSGQSVGTSGQPGGTSGQPGSASSQPGATSGQQGTQSPSQGGSAPAQQGQGGAPAQSSEAGGSSGSSGGSGSGAGAFLTPNDPALARLQLAASLELIDAALPAVTSSQAEESVEDARSNSGLSPLFGAAAVFVGGYQVALRTSTRLRGEWVLGPREAGRRYGSHSQN
jgi:hypothetical protein